MTMKQPAINAYIQALSNEPFWGATVPSYDEESCGLLDELFCELDQIKPMTETGVKSLWFTSDRGELEDVCDVDELIAEGEYENIDKVRLVWQDELPNKREWYSFVAVDLKDQNYRTISLQHRTVIIQDGNRGHSGCSYDIAEFVQWILDSVRQCISMVKAGVYNSYIEQNLPPHRRTGTIMRKNYWDIWPDQRESFFRNITSEEVALFCKMAYSQLPLEEITERIYKMTANDFYKMCALGYGANHYDGCEKTAKEQYYLFADGRDDGLDELDPDSPEEFHSWLNNRERFGGHPWEVCRGGSSTHISLYVHEDLKGCILILSGNSYSRTIETVKFYLALKAADVPVYLNDANLLADRLTEREIIGIVPRGVMPICCASYFPGQKVTSYLNLPDEHREEFIRACNWQSEAEVMLNEKTEGL